MFLFPCRVRSLSSGNPAGPPSPTKLPSTTTPTTPLGKKLHFKLAEYRYGKEELLQLYSDEFSLPNDLPTISTITLVEVVTPLAFIPLSEEEQVLYYCVQITDNCSGEISQLCSLYSLACGQLSPKRWLVPTTANHCAHLYVLLYISVVVLYVSLPYPVV